jgi:putative heme-binding domain-containing protein
VKVRTLIRALTFSTLVLGTGFRTPVIPASKARCPETRFTAESTEITEKTGLSGSVCSVVDFKLTEQLFLQAAAPQSAAIQTGGTLFRERCADCHGAEAKGDRGPDLTRLWTSEAADSRAFQTIRSGVPGSIMPPSQATDEEIRAIVAYLRSISTTVAGERPRGNMPNGERIFWASCGGCHRVNDRGGRLGPDLSQIASSQPRDSILRSIRDASESITSGYEPVTLVTRDGRRIRGIRKGEDAFSIQIMDTGERLQGYIKAELREVSRDTQSVMPSFAADRLSAADLDDLLAFLGTLRSKAVSERGRP